MTVAYIAELQNHLVGRVRTHGDRTFRKLNKNIRVGANLNEKSSLKICAASSMVCMLPRKPCGVNTALVFSRARLE